RVGFEAFVELRYNRTLSPSDMEFHFQNLAVMMRRLEGQVIDYANRRLTGSEGVQRWTPAAAIVQVLLARAWLLGATTPNATLAAQLRAILSEETPPSHIDGRGRLWGEFLKKTAACQESFRDALREMLGTPQGDARKFGLSDLSVAAGAMVRL